MLLPSLVVIWLARVNSSHRTCIIPVVSSVGLHMKLSSTEPAEMHIVCVCVCVQIAHLSLFFIFFCSPSPDLEMKLTSYPHYSHTQIPLTMYEHVAVCLQPGSQVHVYVCVYIPLFLILWPEWDTHACRAGRSWLCVCHQQCTSQSMLVVLYPYAMFCQTYMLVGRGNGIDTTNMSFAEGVFPYCVTFDERMVVLGK